MTLSNLIRKGGLATAIATPATLATREPARAVNVAEVATVIVASAAEPMTRADAERIRAWLDLIGESDAKIVAEVLQRCDTDVEAREYFLRECLEAGQTHDADDRRHCRQCANLARSGLCLAARRDEINTSSDYHPADHIPRRCEAYAPQPDDPDQRSGWERWPGLAQKRDKR